jgi:hypothetical protein
MNGIGLIRRYATRATWLWQALPVGLAIGLLACDGSTVPPVGPTPTPTPNPPTAWVTLGYYEVTMSAAPSCALPEYAMKANYGEARIAQIDRNLDVLFDPYGPFGDMGFKGTIDGQNLRFTLNGTQDPDPDVYSFIAWVDNVEVAYSGTAAGTMDGKSIVATFDGTVRVFLRSDHTVIATCTASDHRMEMVRRH